VGFVCGERRGKHGTGKPGAEQTRNGFHAKFERSGGRTCWDAAGRAAAAFSPLAKVRVT
jgi:hypothetical protein